MRRLEPDGEMGPPLPRLKTSGGSEEMNRKAPEALRFLELLGIFSTKRRAAITLRHIAQFI